MNTLKVLSQKALGNEHVRIIILTWSFIAIEVLIPGLLGKLAEAFGIITWIDSFYAFDQVTFWGLFLFSRSPIVFLIGWAVIASFDYFTKIGWLANEKSSGPISRLNPVLSLLGAFCGGLVVTEMMIRGATGTFVYF